MQLTADKHEGWTSTTGRGDGLGNRSKLPEGQGTGPSPQPQAGEGGRGTEPSPQPQAGEGGRGSGPSPQPQAGGKRLAKGWRTCQPPDTVKGLLVAVFGGGVPAGFVAPFTRIAYEASHVPSLEILLFRCLLHLSLGLLMRYRRVPLFGPRAAWRSIFIHAFINVVSIGCAYSSFMVIPAGNAATVRKGTSTLCSTMMALVINSYHLTIYDWIGLLGSMIGLVLIVAPDLASLEKGSRLSNVFGYILAMLGGLALAMGLMIFRSLTHPSKLLTAAFAFGVVGTLLCGPLTPLLQKPILPADPLTWSCALAITILALVSFICANYAVTMAHPALVCAFLHSEVVVTMVIQYYVLHEPVTPFDISGASVIIGSLAVITAQKMAHKEEGKSSEVK
ncbi:solute carrier family 35 member G3-like [Heptranchias perlo]|uniref:solute carrier family 35 member G3-like n=1 Tax=Heptranchias perlo TaxID=212740 RepID=UPI00355981A4